MPRAATIYMDDDGASTGWFFDPTPTDDVEFTGSSSAFDSSFWSLDVNVGEIV